MDGKSWLDKYSAGRPAPESPEADPLDADALDAGALDAGAQGEEPGAEESGSYQAFLATKGPRLAARVQLVQAGGETWGVPYAQITLSHYLPPDMVALHTPTHVFIIEGRGLEALDALLMEEKCRRVVTFDASTHGTAPASGPLVDRIKVRGPGGATVDYEGHA